MSNLVITYNIDDATNRKEFVEKFEGILKQFGFSKEDTNQSTYYGFFSRRPQDFVKELFNAVNKMDWKSDDTVTIYYPKPTKTDTGTLADIGRHALKSEGSTILNHIIFNL